MSHKDYRDRRVFRWDNRVWVLTLFDCLYDPQDDHLHFLSSGPRVAELVLKRSPQMVKDLGQRRDRLKRYLGLLAQSFRVQMEAQ